MPAKPPDARTRADAWVGDAVLSLYARQWILRERGAMDGELLAAMTSNQFLANFGNATEVEAELGRIYQADGLDAAFARIEERFIPLAVAQLKKRQHRR